MAKRGGVRQNVLMSTGNGVAGAVLMLVGGIRGGRRLTNHLFYDKVNIDVRAVKTSFRRIKKDFLRGLSSFSFALKPHFQGPA